jgi:hypothetical protein
VTTRRCAQGRGRDEGTSAISGAGDRDRVRGSGVFEQLEFDGVDRVEHRELAGGVVER